MDGGLQGGMAEQGLRGAEVVGWGGGRKSLLLPLWKAKQLHPVTSSPPAGLSN